MSQALHPMLNIAIKAARSAGVIISRASMELDLVKVNTKAPNDFVTEVDHAAEAAIIETLLAAYPGHGILAEESGRTHGAKDSEYVWIIDPLDGTTNFIHGLPMYSVSIALSFRGQLQQGVVYDPARNDLFYASKGRGAFLNDRRLRVSKRNRMADALIGTGFPFRRGDDFRRYMDMLELAMMACAGVRRPGSAALDLCHVAAGHYDGFFEPGLSPWDMAAGALMVTEAGGLVGNFTGESDFLHQREVIAGNPKIYGQLVQMLSAFSHIGKEVVTPPEASRDSASATSATSATGAAGAAQATPEAALAASLSAPPPAKPAGAMQPTDTPATPAKRH